MGKILITGATGGIGSGIAKSLAAKGNDLILVSRDLGNLKALQKELESTSVDVQLVAADVSDHEALKKAFDRISDVDVLINCAGILGPVGRFGDNDISEWEKTIRINLLGTINTCSILLSRLKASRRGKIINFSGGGGAFARTFHSAYATSKAAVVRFTENLAMEYPEIDANVIAPGAHKTKIWDTETHDIPPDRWADPERLYSLIEYLSSESSDNLSGKFLHIYDDWDKRDYRKLNGDMYTLRRVDDAILKKLGSK